LKGEELPKLPSLTELNRVQPKVEKIRVIQQTDNRESVDVGVEVSSVAGQCLKGGKRVSCESGVYDLRLYRDGQLVGQSPAPIANIPTTKLTERGWREQLQQWRRSNLVMTEGGQSVTVAAGKQEIVFRNIRLPQRANVSQVEFTAYAFNDSRVKSATSAPTPYPLPPSRRAGKRRAYIITVGVDATSDPNWRLSFAPNGAREIEQLLSKALAAEYKTVPVRLISEYKEDDAGVAPELPTKANIRAVLSLLSTQGGEAAQRQSPSPLEPATPDDLVVLYIASHGYADPQGTFYVIPSDVGEPAGVSEQLLNRCLHTSEQSSSCDSAREFLRHSISSDELTQWLQGIDAGRRVLILDSCHSGAVSGPNFKPGPMGDRGFGQLSYDKGMMVLAATQAENVAWGTLELEDRSLLTYALTRQQTPAQPLDFRQWLSRAEKLVPDLYSRNVNERQRQQEPMLFDFARGRVAGADGAP
jgi:hypothetical protein